MKVNSNLSDALDFVIVHAIEMKAKIFIFQANDRLINEPDFQ